MKFTQRYTTFFVILMSVFVMIQCSSRQEQKTEEESQTDDEWKEMDEFHMVMAESFHPYKDSANLDPARELAVEMATLAEKWAGAPLPDKVDTDDVRQNLEALKNETKSFSESVSTGDSAVLGESLTAIHDRFHHLMEAWYHGGGQEHDH